MQERVYSLLNAQDVEHSGPTQLRGRQEPIDVYRLGNHGLTAEDKTNECLDCPREQDLLHELT